MDTRGGVILPPHDDPGRIEMEYRGLPIWSAFLLVAVMGGAFIAAMILAVT